MTERLSRSRFGDEENEFCFWHINLRCVIEGQVDVSGRLWLLRIWNSGDRWSLESRWGNCQHIDSIKAVGLDEKVKKGRMGFGSGAEDKGLAKNAERRSQ